MGIFTGYMKLNYYKAILSTIRILPSLHIGSASYHRWFPRRGNLLLYVTNRCNSKCLICSHWSQPEKVDLDIKIIEDLVKSKTIGKANWTIEGGEVFCYPDVLGMLGLLQKHKVNYTLFTNGIMPYRLESAVKMFKVRSVDISLDGPKTTYQVVRGFDGYDLAVESIDRIKKLTNLQVVFTASPWNTYEDYEYVRDLCKKKNVRLMFNIYCDAVNTGVLGKDKYIDYRHVVYGTSPYQVHYNFWTTGNLKLLCHSVAFTVPVMPNGDVVLCASKVSTVLGNLHDNSLDYIWNQDKTKELQREHLKCNACWVSCYRNFDIRLAQLRGVE